MLRGLKLPQDHSREQMVTWHRKPLKDLVSQCFRCGLCRAVCPVFLQDGREPAVARAKLQLVAALSGGDLQPSERLAHLLSRCLACGACEAVCPADVAVTEAVLRARCELAAALKLDGTEPAPANAALNLDRPDTKPEDAALARWARYLQVLHSRPERPLSAALALLSGRPAEDLSHRADHPDAAGLPRTIEPARARMQVAYFPGCADLLWPQLWQPIFALFRSSGVRAVLPAQSFCCGYPFLEAGDPAMARQLANENIRAFERLEIEAIVTGCSAGQRMLDRYIGEILGLTGFPVPIYELGEFLKRLVREGALPKPWAPVSARVGYLPPQGLGRSADGAVELLKQVPDLEPVLLSDDQGCGGSLFLAAVHPELHEQIMKRTVEAVTDRGCQALVAHNPLSMYLLDRYLEQHQANLRVVHLAEVLAMACAGGETAVRETFPENPGG